MGLAYSKDHVLLPCAKVVRRRVGLASVLGLSLWRDPPVKGKEFLALVLVDPIGLFAAEDEAVSSPRSRAEGKVAPGELGAAMRAYAKNPQDNAAVEALAADPGKRLAMPLL